MHLKPNQRVDTVFLCKPVDQIVLVLIDSLDKIGRDSDIQGTVPLAREDVDTRPLLSCWRRPASRLLIQNWIPAFAGMTCIGISARKSVKDLGVKR